MNLQNILQLCITSIITLMTYNSWSLTKQSETNKIAFTEKNNNLVNANVANKSQLVEVRKTCLVLFFFAFSLLTGIFTAMSYSALAPKLNVYINLDNTLAEYQEFSYNSLVVSSLFMKNNKEKWKWLFVTLYTIYIGFLFKLNIANFKFSNIKTIFRILGIPDYIIQYMGIVFGILALLFVLRCICIIYIIYLHVNNKVPTSIFIPSFITKWIALYKYVLDYKDDKERLSKIINFYYKSIYVFLFFSFIYFSIAFYY